LKKQHAHNTDNINLLMMEHQSRIAKI